jgi:hypothetical protein
MAANQAIQSPADLANLALVRMGYKLRVGSLYDGSAAAKKILDVYAQTRDELLRNLEPPFSQRNVAANLLKQAPAIIGGFGYIPPAVWNPVTNPPLPWLFSYTYPADALKVRAIKAQPLFIPNFDPQDNVFSVVNDNTYTPAQRVILCNVPNAVLTYTGQITDPTTFDVSFLEIFAATLGRHLGAALVGVEGAKMEAQDEAMTIAQSNMEMG